MSSAMRNVGQRRRLDVDDRRRHELRRRACRCSARDPSRPRRGCSSSNMRSRSLWLNETGVRGLLGERERRDAARTPATARAGTAQAQHANWRHESTDSGEAAPSGERRRRRQADAVNCSLPRAHAELQRRRRPQRGADACADAGPPRRRERRLRRFEVAERDVHVDQRRRRARGSSRRRSRRRRRRSRWPAGTRCSWWRRAGR